MTRATVHRSPRYPFISLPVALERAEKLYQAAKLASMTIDAAADAWGYTAKSSGVTQTIAALKQYGLLIDGRVGTDRSVQLRDAALNLLYPVDARSPEHQRALEAAALAPRIFHELRSHWPDEEKMRSFLLRKAFNLAIVERVMTNFRDTLVFAGIAGGATAEKSTASPTLLGADARRAVAEAASGTGQNLLSIPLIDGLTLRVVLEHGNFTKRHSEILKKVADFAGEHLIEK